MNTDPNSNCIPSGLVHLGAARLIETTRSTRSQDIFGIIPGFLALMSQGLSMVARIFDGIADQRDSQAKQIIAQYGQVNWSDGLERKIERCSS
jgi:hypothetical protein